MRHLPALLCLLALSLGAAPAHAHEGRAQALREAVRARQAERAALKATLHAVAERTPAQLFHQVRDPKHRDAWARALKRPLNSRRVHRAWVAAGSYPGVWTLEDSDGWYSANVAGTPFRIALKPGTVLYDADDPKQAAVYKAWVAGDKKLRGDSPRNLFQKLTNAEGTPLARRTAGIHAPPEERFYRELGVAGVAHYDVWGRKCIIILNPDAIAEVDTGLR